MPQHRALDMADAGQRQRGLSGSSLKGKSLRQLFAVQTSVDDSGGEVVGDGIGNDDALEALRLSRPSQAPSQA